ncbi:hypothetical protein E5288_WYG013931 [Bos mutus]|uniref:Uncharacterized protein n=1 Tax=Bos mutus TaxID=72004 RepID=A0A6B0RIP4_9CETA|nr:hypothetical protein [Bos mutus]
MQGRGHYPILLCVTGRRGPWLGSFYHGQTASFTSAQVLGHFNALFRDGQLLFHKSHAEVISTLSSVITSSSKQEGIRYSNLKTILQQDDEKKQLKNHLPSPQIKGHKERQLRSKIGVGDIQIIVFSSQCEQDAKMLSRTRKGSKDEKART